MSNKDNEFALQVYEKMMETDQFSKWLGLKLDKIKEGFCQMHFEIKEQMLNGFDSVHGGILFAASDSAFAFACNTHGLISVALDVHISYVRPAKEGEELTVIAQKVHLGNKIGIYEVKIENEKGELVSIFKGTAYRTSKEVLENE